MPIPNKPTKSAKTPSTADPYVPPPSPNRSPGEFSLLLEDGQRIPASANQARAFRAQGDDGKMYDHCSESFNGEWVYRLVK